MFINEFSVSVTSQNYDTRIENEANQNGTWSRMERSRDRERDRERGREADFKLPEPKVNGILKNSPGSRRRKRRDGGGYDNDAYTPSVSSTEDGSDFDFETYRKAIEQGVPSGNAKHFSMMPDPPRDRRDRRDRRRREDLSRY